MVRQDKTRVQISMEISTLETLEKLARDMEMTKSDVIECLILNANYKNELYVRYNRMIGGKCYE